MKRHDKIITPDGYIAQVLLCGGCNILVVLLYAHVKNKYRTYPKSAFEGKVA